ncbi:hypothetical protein [uncultured Draconibacterium sp.]|uniref:hypothetical protein n=1 Tax=uncultured Draconibacterium sp. TaxID=1573823 RepID=UPI00321749A3
MSKEKLAFWDGSGKIIPHLLYRFLGDQGFGKYFTDKKRLKNTESLIVKRNGNIVSEVNVGYLLETVNNYVKNYFEEGGEIGPVLDSLHKNTSLFGDRNLKFLPTLNLEFISDTRKNAFFFFRNGVVQVDKHAIVVKGYNEFDRCVWENSIINQNFVPVENGMLRQKCDFMNFLVDITTIENTEQAIKRFNSLCSALGYLLHRYKDGTTTKAVILMDVYVNGKPNGGSGKTLAINAVGKIRNQASIDGKKFDQREWFGLSSVEIGTEFILFDDVRQNFDFEQLFPLMTEGLYLRRKYKDHIFIPQEKSPKIALTTNYAINGDSSSHKRRKFEFEVSPTYSSKFTPRDKFGRNFFNDWNEEDWNYFYNTMLGCLQLYLKSGFIESEPININLTKLINNTCEEFVEWADDGVMPEIQLDKKELYNSFLLSFPEYNPRLKQREFTNWLREWGNYKRYKWAEGHTDALRYIIYS